MELVKNTRFFMSLGVILLASAACSRSSDSQTKIIGGQPTAEQDFDNVVAIVKDNDSFCTGTLVHPQLVITAAHCLDPDIFMEFEKPLENTIKVYFGPGLETAAPLPSADQVAVKKVQIHPEYKKSPIGEYDIGYLVLEKPVTQEQRPNLKFQPILTQAGDIVKLLETGSDVRLIGFGLRNPNNNASSGAKYQVDTRNSKAPKINEIELGQPGKTSCSGDSGGPAFVKNKRGEWLVFGVTSRGPSECGGANIYGMMHASLCWIQADSGIALEHSLDCSGNSHTLDDTAIAALDFLKMCENPQILSAAAQRTFSIIRSESIFADDDCAFTQEIFDLDSFKDFSHAALTDISPIVAYSNLETLWLRGNSIQSIAPLKRLKKLTSLDISYNNIPQSEIAALQAALPELKITGATLQKYNMRQTKFLEICQSPTATAGQKQTLRNIINFLDILPIYAKFPSRGSCSIANEKLIHTSMLLLNNSKITDLSPLEGLENLTMLTLDGNPLQDIKVLQTLPKLNYVSLENTSVAADDPTLKVLQDRGALVTFEAEPQGWADKSIYKLCQGETQATPDQIRNFLILAESTSAWTDYADCRQMTIEIMNRKVISVFDKPLTDLNLVRDLTEVEEISISSSQVSDLGPLVGLKGLTSLGLKDAKVRDLSPLATLENLEGLTLIGNPVSDLSPLVGLPKLKFLDIEGTQVTDLSVLKGISSLTRVYAGGTPALQSDAKAPCPLPETQPGLICTWLAP